LTHPNTIAPASGRTPAGFTLVEVVISVALGAVVLLALTASTGLLGAQVTSVSSDLNHGLEQALTTLTSDIRTAYFLEDDALKVARPSGVSGGLQGAVDGLDFSVGTLQRLRSDTSRVSHGSFWSSALSGVPLTPSVPILDPDTDPHFDLPAIAGVWAKGDELAIGFTLAGQAPDTSWPQAVDDPWYGRIQGEYPTLELQGN
jgi:prepilin-type N-terminal cleavage/methylation domain-containing protein